MTGNVLASTSFSGKSLPKNETFVRITFYEGVHVQEGNKYMIRANISPFTHQVSWHLAKADVYLNGTAYYYGMFYHDSDLLFRTYVADTTRDYSTVLSVDSVSGNYGDQATLTATLTNVGNPLPNQTVEFSVNGNHVGSAVTNSSGVAQLSYNMALPPGSYTVSASYEGTTPYQSSAGSNQLNIDKATVVVTVNSDSRIYGDPNPVFTASYSGLASWDTPDDLGTLAFTTEASPTSPVNTYPIHASGLSSDNYQITYVEGGLTVTEAPLTVTVDNATRWVNEPNPSFTGTIDGLLSGDSITASYTTTAQTDSPPGDYPIDATLHDAANRLGNYEASLTQGKLTVYSPPQPIFQEGDSLSSVTRDVYLPSVDQQGFTVRWTSSNPDVIDPLTGAVKRPSFAYGDADIDLQVSVDQNNTTYTATYTLRVKRAERIRDGSTDGGSDAGSDEGEESIVSRNGSITIPKERSGEVHLDDEFILRIPSEAAEQELYVTIENLGEMSGVLTDQVKLVSNIFEVLKNVSDHFKKPVTLSIKFDPGKVGKDQKVAIFYYDEEDKRWVEVGGEVEGDLITAEIDHFTKFAVLAVDVNEEDVEVTPKQPEVTFTDIAGHWAERSIIAAASQKLVNGYPDGTLKPNNPITRAEFTVMLVNALRMDGAVTTLVFTDQDKIGSWAKHAIALAVQHDIINGYGDGSFRPDAFITRTEISVMIARALGVTMDVNVQTGFDDDEDIPHWAIGAVEAIRNLESLVAAAATNLFRTKRLHEQKQLSCCLECWKTKISDRHPSAGITWRST